MPTRFRAERSQHLPAGAVNSHHVYDFTEGQVAREKFLDPASGRLAYFRTRREAREWAARANVKHEGNTQ